MTILVAGASGSIGREVVRLLVGPPHEVRALVRRPESVRAVPAQVAAVAHADLTTCPDAFLNEHLAGVQTVISCAGAPVLPGAGDRASFERVDTLANTRLLEAAQASGVLRFLYIGLHRHEAYAGSAYARAHERVADRLARSGLSYSVVEPTGVYSALLELVRFARRGRLPLIGDGSARTNPIDPRDVAQCVASHLIRGPERIPVGGPQVLTRDEIAETAFAALGRRPSLLHVPESIVSGMGKLIRPFHARAGELMEFYAKVNCADCIAPMYGSRKLKDYFREAILSRQV